jgi:predicted ester cyclase
MGEAEAGVVVERYLAEVLNGGEPASAAELIASERLRQSTATFRAAFPDAGVTTQLMLQRDGLVAVHLSGRGTQLGMFQGCPPTGRTWTASCTAIYRVRRGRIAEGWINWDWLAAMEQLGCVQRVETVSA